jgi:hypothetical protein
LLGSSLINSTVRMRTDKHQRTRITCETGSSRVLLDWPLPDIRKDYYQSHGHLKGVIECGWVESWSKTKLILSPGVPLRQSHLWTVVFALYYLWSALSQQGQRAVCPTEPLREVESQSFPRSKHLDITNTLSQPFS